MKDFGDITMARNTIIHPAISDLSYDKKASITWCCKSLAYYSERSSFHPSFLNDHKSKCSSNILIIICMQLHYCTTIALVVFSDCPLNILFILHWNIVEIYMCEHTHVVKQVNMKMYCIVLEMCNRRIFVKCVLLCIFSFVPPWLMFHLCDSQCSIQNASAHFSITAGSSVLHMEVMWLKYSL